MFSFCNLYCDGINYNVVSFFSFFSQNHRLFLIQYWHATDDNSVKQSDISSYNVDDDDDNGGSDCNDSCKVNKKRQMGGYNKQ